MESLGTWWKRLPAAVRKPLVLISGTIIVIVGLLLVPLPGPGWVIVFAGLALLATEFAVARRLRDWLVKALQQGFSKIKSKLKKHRTDEKSPRTIRKP